MYQCPWCERKTFSFWQKCSVSGNYAVALRNGSANSRAYYPSPYALTADSWLFSESLTLRRPLMVLPWSSVVPTTMPIASARNTATIETRW